MCLLPSRVSSTAIPLSSSAIPFLYHCTACSFSPVARGRAVTHQINNTTAQKTTSKPTCVVFVDPQRSWNIFEGLLVVVFNNFPAVLAFTCVHFGWHYTDVALFIAFISKLANFFRRTRRNSAFKWHLWANRHKVCSIWGDVWLKIIQYFCRPTTTQTTAPLASACSCVPLKTFPHVSSARQFRPIIMGFCYFVNPQKNVKPLASFTFKLLLEKILTLWIKGTCSHPILDLRQQIYWETSVWHLGMTQR